jgi:hypothetical protein
VKVVELQLYIEYAFENAHMASIGNRRVAACLLRLMKMRIGYLKEKKQWRNGMK